MRVVICQISLSYVVLSGFNWWLNWGLLLGEIDWSFKVIKSDREEYKTKEVVVG